MLRPENHRSSSEGKGPMGGAPLDSLRAERLVQTACSILTPHHTSEYVPVDTSPVGVQPLGPVCPYVIHLGEMDGCNGQEEEPAGDRLALAKSSDTAVTDAAYRHSREGAITAVPDTLLATIRERA
jgi:hypothetical protein